MQVNEESHDKVLTELKIGKYNLDWIESSLNMPQSTLSHAISGRRNIPSKYLFILIKELKL
jgi:hypothetical protein